MKGKYQIKFLIFFGMVLFGFLSFSSCKEQTLLAKDKSYTNDRLYDETMFSSVEAVDVAEGEDEDLAINEFLNIPSEFNVSRAESIYKISLSWGRVSYGVSDVYYHIYRSVAGEPAIRISGNSPIKETEFSQNIYEDDIAAGEVYLYMIRAVVPSLLDDTGHMLAGRTTGLVSGFLFNRVSNLAATQREYIDYVELNWEPVVGAEYYTLYRAVADDSGNPPTYEQEYVGISSALTTTTYRDYSELKQGDLRASLEYYYIVRAHISAEIVSFASPPAKGSVLAFGAPPAVEIIDVTSSILKDFIRILWVGNDSDEYIINRIPEESYQFGDFFGNSITVVPEQLGSITIDIEGTSTECFYYFDNDTSLNSGNPFYYRVAGINSLGAGKFTDFSSSTAVELTQGNCFRNYEGMPIEVLIMQDGYHISWPEDYGANAYLVYRSEVNPSVDDTKWVRIGTALDLYYHDPVSNFPSGFDIESGELFYKLIPINNDFITDPLNDGNITVDSSYLYFGDQTLADLQAELDAITDFDSLLGQSSYSSYGSDYTVPVPVFSVTPMASDDDDSCEGSIRLSGKISNVTGLHKLNVKVIRTCYYGDETGVSPLNEPRKSIGGISFTKKGVPLVAGVEVLDIEPHINLSTGEFSFLDPMHEFRDGQLLADDTQSDGLRKHKWDYASWDTEAWKFIKRQLPFDMETSVKVNYEFRIERSSDPTWGLENATEVGYPALTNKEMAHLILWLKDVAMNRASMPLIPRYGWDKTIAWLPGNEQRTQGEYNKHRSEDKATWFWAVLQGLGAHGEGGVDWGYSDWPGFISGTVDKDHNSANIIMDVGISAGYFWVTTSFGAITPLYEGYIFYNINAYSYNYHWGLAPRGRERGTFTLWHKGREITFPAEEIIVTEFEVEGKVFGREAFDAGSDSGSDSFPASNNFGDTCVFTRINFEYRPYPTNTDFIKEQFPVMYYGYQY